MSVVLEPVTDVAATMAEFGFATGLGYILKTEQDLARYSRIIADTGVQVVVECGTNAGNSAAWFTRQGVDVVTIDVNPRLGDRAALRHRDLRAAARITYLTGDSTDRRIVATVLALTDGRRTLVSLDSGHTREHVRTEIGLYGPLVTPGCHLVVEDGIFRFATPAQWRKHHFGDPAQGNPLDAIEDCLAADPGWRRDVDIEASHPITHHVAGWWVKL